MATHPAPKCWLDEIMDDETTEKGRGTALRYRATGFGLPRSEKWRSEHEARIVRDYVVTRAEEEQSRPLTLRLIPNDMTDDIIARVAFPATRLETARYRKAWQEFTDAMTPRQPTFAGPYAWRPFSNDDAPLAARILEHDASQSSSPAEVARKFLEDNPLRYPTHVWGDEATDLEEQMRRFREESQRRLKPIIDFVTRSNMPSR